MTNTDNETSPVSSTAKQQSRALLLFLGYNFQGYHINEWFQWKNNVQLLAKGTDVTIRIQIRITYVLNYTLVVQPMFEHILGCRCLFGGPAASHKVRAHS
eukprot:2681287-Ditylum_brightwellii.AAC.1